MTNPYPAAIEGIAHSTSELGGRYRKRYSSMSGYIEQTWIQMITGRTCFPKSIILIDYLIEPLPGKVCWSLLRAGGAA